MFLETCFVLLEKNTKDGSKMLLRKLLSDFQNSGCQISVPFTLSNVY